MSKTTITLLVILVIFLGFLLSIIFGTKQDNIIATFTQQPEIQTSTADATLSFSTTEPAIRPGQTVTTTILIHNPNSHTGTIQLEIAYDPTTITIDSITPGTFFTNPTVPLQNIDPVAGRISYALRCPVDRVTNIVTDCTNSAASTVATITFTLNAYTIQSTTGLSFFPKTAIRTDIGKDILKKTSNVTFTINKSFFPTASSSAIASPEANYIHVTPIH